MEVRLTKEEVVEAIKEYVSNKLKHETAEVIDSQFMPGATVVLGESKAIDRPGIKVAPVTWADVHVAPNYGTVTACNLMDIAPDTFGENK